MANSFAALIRNLLAGMSNEERIEHSRPTWTQVEDSGANSARNVEVFKNFQEDPRWGGFFHTFREGELEKGEMIAEGGQAKIYEAQIICPNQMFDKDIQWVLKVFHKDYCLENLRLQWPDGLLKYYSERVLKHHSKRAGEMKLIPRYNCDVQCGTLLKDGSFAFLMQREQADLRTLIDEAMKVRADQNSGPFSAEIAGSCMQQIAQGMLWLHDNGIIHRDLKAANVLIREDDGEYYCFVADYECSGGGLGTRFWRAPEILEAVKERKVSQKLELFTRAADIYSYGMTCYEILTDEIPFDGHFGSDFDLVLNGTRPEVPKYVDNWARELLSRCWECNPGARPSFEEILNLLSAGIRGDATYRRRVYWTMLVTEMMSMYVSGTYFTAVEEQIELSESHWSSFAGQSSEDSKKEVAENLDNKEVFKTLQMHPTWGQFFQTFGYDFGISESSGELEVGKKINVGGQAELFSAKVKWRNPELNEEDLEEGRRWALKVFPMGPSLRELQKRWPHGIFKLHVEKPKYIVNVFCGLLMEDGRFAFLMEREQEDLRSLIDRKMLWKNGQDCGPFSKEIEKNIMYNIALGMDWLHTHDVVHRDLKSANVLVKVNKDGSHQYLVCDFECSIGVIGTRFWRAPEILQACKDRGVSKKPEVFTKAIDSYSYGMTCYEILTGKLPFEDHPLSDDGLTLIDLVIDGLRPEVPDFVDDWAHRLLKWCWQSDPAARPSFEEILGMFEALKGAPT